MVGRVRDVVALALGQLVAFLMVGCCCFAGAAVMVMSDVAFGSMAEWFDAPGFVGGEIVTSLGLMLTLPVFVFVSSTWVAGASQSMLYPVEVLRADVWPKWWGGVVSGLMTGFFLQLPSLFFSFFAVLVGFGQGFTQGVFMLMMYGAVVGGAMLCGGFCGGVGAVCASTWRVHRAKKRGHSAKLRSSRVMSMA